MVTHGVASQSSQDLALVLLVLSVGVDFPLLLEALCIPPHKLQAL